MRFIEVIIENALSLFFEQDLILFKEIFKSIEKSRLKIFSRKRPYVTEVTKERFHGNVLIY